MERAREYSHIYSFLKLYTKAQLSFFLCHLQLKRSRETESQLKPLVEKNKRMSKKNDDMMQCIQRMEEKIKNLSRENVELVSNNFWYRVIRELRYLEVEMLMRLFFLIGISESQQWDDIAARVSQCSWIFTI